ncbi:MAG: hypothetical protein AB8B64_12070 [Granulosicoccus sp.]
MKCFFRLYRLPENVQLYEDIPITSIDYVNGVHAATYGGAFFSRFPLLLNITLEHTSSGLICLSRNYTPAWEKLEPSVWLPVCHNGMCVAIGTNSETLIADMATERENSLAGDMRLLVTPVHIPLGVFKEIGFRAAMGWHFRRRCSWNWRWLAAGPLWFFYWDQLINLTSLAVIVNSGIDLSRVNCDAATHVNLPNVGIYPSCTVEPSLCGEKYQCRTKKHQALVG